MNVRSNLQSESMLSFMYYFGKYVLFCNILTKVTIEM